MEIEKRENMAARSDALNQNAYQKDRMKQTMRDWSAHVDRIYNASNPQTLTGSVRVMDSPLVLSLVGGEYADGARRLGVYIDESKVQTIASGTKHLHHLSKDQVKQIPAALADPIAIFESTSNARDSKTNDVVFMLDLKDQNGANVVAAIWLDQERIGLSVNKLASYYGKESVKKGKIVPNSSWFNQQVGAGRLMYVNTKKALHRTASGLLVLPVDSNGELIDKSIKTERDLVKLRHANPTYYQSILEPGDFDEVGNVRPAALREIEQEKNEIISAAQRGGTYMKAPNGRPSSLTGEHWALIRTKRFKNWFGDWDASWKKEAIRNQESVIVGHVTGKAAELLDQYTNKAPGVRTAIKSYALSVLPREVHTRALGKVFISGSSIKDTLSHSRGVMKFESLFCIDKLLSSAVEVGTEKIEKGITTHVLARKTLWNDEEFVVVMAVNEDQNGNRFYDHEMTEIKKLNELSTAPAVNGKVGGSEKAHRSLLSILREDVWNVNDFSQVVDENGEPLVVYHGTGTSDITEFKTSKATDKVGRLMALGEGKGKFYFTSNEQGARLAGEGAVARGQGRDAAVMPVFLNLRNPMPLQEYRSRYQSMTGHGLNEGYADGYTMQDRDKAIAALDRQIKKEGYDGIFDPAQNYYVAFNSDQIKSVENRGTFDGSNANIFYQIIGERGAQALDKAQEVSTRMDNLDVARQMRETGKDKKSVWLATGWQIGLDGKWRYEIADGKWKVEAFDDKNVVKPLGVKNWRMTLGDIYNAPELYQAYPELKNVDVNITQMRDGTLGLSHGRSITLSETLFPVKNGAEIEARLADFMASEPWIEYQKALDDALELDDPDEANEIVNKLDDEWENSPIGYAMAKLFKKQQVLEPSQKAMEVLVHEVQHSVQRLEGLANGASVFEGRVRFEAEEEILATYVGEAWTEAVAHVEEIKARRSEAKARRQAWKREHRTTPLMAQSRGDAEAFKQWQNLDAEVKRLDDAYFKADEELHNKKSEILKLYDREVRESAFKKYQSVGGEVEARNASKRLSLSEAERKLSALSATEDVAREDQIILENALNGARQAMNFGQSAAVMEYERRLERDSTAWGSIVDKFANGTLRDGKHTVMSAPLALTLAGARLDNRFTPRKIVTTSAVLKKILSGKHANEINATLMKQIPEALADPVMVFRSATQNDSLVAMLKLKSKNGASIIAPVALNTQDGNLNKSIVMTSLYGRGFPVPNNQWFIDQINEGRLFYINKQKSTAWAISCGLQLPYAGIASGVYGNIVKTDVDLVKLREQGNNTFYQSAATDPLVSVHKISEESLLKAAALGGLPVPSIGITKAESPFHGFGGISLIGTRDMVNPSEVPVYSRDAYTTRFPATVWDKVPVKKQATFMKAFRPAFEKVGDLSFLSSLMYVVENEPDRDRAMREFARSEGAKAAFLESKGVALEPVMRAAQERSTGSMSPELQALVKSDSDKQYFVGGDEMHRKVSEAYYAAMEREGIKGRAKDKNGLMSYVYASTLFNDAVADSERIGTQEIDSYATRDKLNRLVKEFDDRDYKAFVAEKISALFGEPKVQVGRKKMSFTLENVVAAMAKRAGVGKEEALSFGAGNVRARLSKRFNSMEDMTAARDQVVSPEDALATDTASNDAMTAFRDVAVGQYDYADSWSAMDDAMRSLADAIKKKPTEANLRAAMKKHGFSNPSAGAIELGLKALTALRGVVTDYFEAKPERAVGLNEFVGAVAPESISPEALKVLQDAGLEVQTYKEGDGAQEAATTELSRSLASTNPNVFFQPAWHDSPLVREGVTRKPDGAKAKVVHLEASAFPALQGKSTKEILVWIKDILRQGGDVKILSTGQTARFTVTNIKASLKRGRESLHNEAYAALREMVSLAEYDHFEPADIKHVTRTAGQDVYYSALEIMGQLYSVRLKMDVVTEEIRQRNATAGIQPEDVRYKDHKLTEIEIAPALFHGMPDNGVPMQNADAISTVSLGILRGNVKPSAYDGAHLSQERRGQISLLSDGSVVISLFEKADRSTFFHEMGHMMLEELIRYGLDPDASGGMKRDLETAVHYLGIGYLDLSRRNNFSEAEMERYRKAQEHFAQSFEAYLMTGKAPSVEMKGIFGKLRRWLLDIYADITRLEVKLSPEIRDLFDRMLATPEEIDAARAESVTVAELAQEEKTAAKRLKELEGGRPIPRVLSAMWDSAALDDKDMPGWVPPELVTGVSDALQLGRPELVKAVKKLGGIDYQSLAAVWGKEEAERLRERDKSLFRKKGAAFDTLVSELAHEGVQVEDAQQLWDRLMADDPAVDRKLNVAIDEESLPWLFYLMTDDEVQRYAGKRGVALNRELKALQSADSPAGLRLKGPAIQEDLNLISEIKATLKDAAEKKRRPSPDSDAGFSGDAEFSADMFKREGEVKRESVPTGEAAEQAAGFMRDEEMISLREADRAAWRRAEKFSKQAYRKGAKQERLKSRAVLRGAQKSMRLAYKEGMRVQRDKARALREAQKVRAAQKAEINKILKDIKKAAADRQISWGIKQRIAEKLKSYTLKYPNKKNLAMAAKIDAYLEKSSELELADLTPSERRYIEMLETTTLWGMSLADVRRLGSEIGEMQLQGREEYDRWVVERDQRREAGWRALMDCTGTGAVMEDDLPTVITSADLGKQYEGVKGKLAKAKDWAYANTLGANRFFDWLGGGKKDYKSAWTQYLVDAVNEALDSELSHCQERYEAMEKRMMDLNLSPKRLNEIRYVDGQKYSVDSLIHIYTGLKNEHSRKAILCGNMGKRYRKQGEEAVNAHAAKCVQALTAEERALGDAIIADFDASFDRLNGAYVAAFNEGMAKEENYTPMKRLEYTALDLAGLRADVSEAELLEGQAVESGARNATLQKGFLNDRLNISEEKQKPIHLGLAALWHDQVAAQEHTAAYGKLAGDLRSMLMKRDDGGNTLGKLVKLRFGSEAVGYLRDYVNIAIEGQVVRAAAVMDDVTAYLGRNMAVAYLALNLGTVLKQFSSLPRFLITAGPGHVINCTRKCLAAIVKGEGKRNEFLENVYAMDPQMKNRTSDAFIQVMKDARKYGKKQSAYMNMLELMMAPISYMDRVVSCIGWQATYDSNIKRGLSRAEAIKEAQRAVALTQQTPLAKDMPRIWNQKGLARLFMLFTSDAANTWGMTVYDLAHGKGNEKLQTVAALALTALMMGYMQGGRDDDEKWISWYLKQLAAQEVGSIPMVGKEFMAAVEALSSGGSGSTYSAISTPFIKLGMGAYNAFLADDAGKTYPDGSTKRERGLFMALEGVSLLTPFPSTLVNRIRRMGRSADAEEAARVLFGMRRQLQRYQRGRR